MLQANQIREYVNQFSHLINIRESTRFPGLSVIKYKHKVFYDALWTPELEEMRGLVVDKDYNPVIVPFRKIFNYNENEATIPLDENVIAVEKINGFMGAWTFVPEHGVVCSTTGSLDSPFVDLAMKHTDEKILAWIGRQRLHTTYLFEVCDRVNDSHIITESDGLHLIGARNVHTGEMASQDELDEIQLEWGDLGVITRRPMWNLTKFSHVLHWAKHALHEGFVVYGKETTLKVKTPYYLTTKFLARCQNDKLEHALVNRVRVDEEFYPLLDYIQENKEKFFSLDAQQRLNYIRDFYYE